LLVVGTVLGGDLVCHGDAYVIVCLDYEMNVRNKVRLDQMEVT
jgi:hypothetical protein